MTNSQYGSGSGSPGGGGTKRSNAAQSLRPVTIKQLLDATQAHSDAEWRVDGHEIGAVTVVAHVMSIQAQTTNCVYWLDDGTGRIEARNWSSSDEEGVDKWGGVTEGIYIRVTGTLKIFGQKRYINATTLRPVTDPNEIEFHFLEAMMVTKILEKGRPPLPGEKPRTSANGHADNSAYSKQHSSAPSNPQWAQLPELQRRIVDYMAAQPPIPEGIHARNIASAIPGGNATAIAFACSGALDDLMDSGFIYSTIDDSHYALSI
ncbi:replication protein A subunit RPA32 [Obba rivulosa]|uniref:Replication protein A subunit RPA32 n=1 Tax=Obba rivulosa TaxID=1052685 RepID=A0A8E2B019_9APHY|nr:replication protein A subunit RPA32 [Obba rivulosa]